MTRLVRVVKNLIVVAVLAYALVTAFFYFAQESILFPAGAVPADYDFGFPDNAEEFWVDRPDGARLHAVRFDNGGSRGVVLYFHGNGGTNARAASFNALYAALGYDLIALDYRGYGKSTGDRTEQAMLADALAFYDAIIEADALPPVIVGRSLGTVFATYVAARRSAQQLILYAPAASIAHVAQHHYPLLPVAILRFPFRTDSFMADVDTPVLVFHGTQDRVIPIESGVKLSKSLKPPDLFIPIPGGTHNSLAWHPDVMASIATTLTTQRVGDTGD